jgi:hypothetical protein
MLFCAESHEEESAYITLTKSEKQEKYIPKILALPPYEKEKTRKREGQKRNRAVQQRKGAQK